MQAKPFQDVETDSETLDASMGRVDALLALLPPTQRAVAVLIALEGLSVREAADALYPRSKSQIDRDWRKAKATLADLLGDPVEGMPGETKFPEKTVDALNEMAPDEAPDLTVSWQSQGSGNPLRTTMYYPQPVEVRPSVTEAEWEAYRLALAAIRKGRAEDEDFELVRSFEKGLGLPSSLPSPAWNGAWGTRRAS